jgi:SHS family lactate transporter-like MFS transporter
MSQEKGGDAVPHTEPSNGRRIIRDNPDENMGFGRYLATRIPTLIPPMDRVENPFKLLAMLNFKQWMFFLVAFCGCDNHWQRSLH